VTQDSLITPAMQQALGSVVATEVADVERGAIRRFAEAIEDPNPLYVDESAAAKVPRLLDGGSAWEYFEPVCAGDHITLVTTVESLTERAGRLGKMLFIVYTTEYSNQDGRPVAVQRNTIIRY
jgi:acyl dehydratase